MSSNHSYPFKPTDNESLDSDSVLNHQMEQSGTYVNYTSNDLFQSTSYYGTNEIPRMDELSNQFEEFGAYGYSNSSNSSLEKSTNSQEMLDQFLQIIDGENDFQFSTTNSQYNETNFSPDQSAVHQIFPGSIYNDNSSSDWSYLRSENFVSMNDVLPMASNAQDISTLQVINA